MSFRLILLYYSIYQYGITFADYSADFVIVGGGAAGSVLAARLSEDKFHQVLLIEAGGEPEHYNDIPYFAPGPYTGNLSWLFFPDSEQNANLAFVNENFPIPQGKGLGGSTLINSMIYGRGNAKDYDTWRDSGNNGWGYQDVLPYYKKLENFQGIFKKGDEKFHGFDGPVTVMPSPYEPELANPFLDAGREIGFNIVDYTGENQTGFSRPFFTLRNGRRLSAYKAYLERLRSRRNLRILTNSFVSKVLFDHSKRAVGVEFAHAGKQHVARAKKEIIISAGAINSPKLLQLSGIGPKEILDKFNIPIIHESPGVGNNLRDHVVIPNLWIALKEQIGFQLEKDATVENFAKLENGRGPLTVPGHALSIAFLDSEFSNVSANWPDLQFYVSQTNYPDPSILKKEYQPNKDQLQLQFKSLE